MPNKRSDANGDDSFSSPYFLQNDDQSSGIGLSNIVAALYRNLKYILFLSFVGAVLGYVFVEERGPSYVADAVVVLQPDNSALDILDISDGLSTNRSTVETQLDVFRSTELLGEVVDRTLTKYSAALADGSAGVPPIPDVPRGEQVKWLANAMSVGRKGESLALRIEVRAPDPVLAADLANEIGQTYIDRRIDQKTSEISMATDILRKRTTETGQQLAENEKELAELVHSKRLNDTELERKLRARVAQLTAQRDNFNVRTDADQTRLDQINTEIDTLENQLIERTIATIQQEELTREIDSNRQHHDQLFEQLLRVEAENIIMSPGAIMVSAAHPPTSPTGLSPKTAAALGFVSTSFFSILITVFLAAFDRRIRTTEQVESILQAPCFGTVPLQKEGDAITLYQSLKSAKEKGKQKVKDIKAKARALRRGEKSEVDKAMDKHFLLSQMQHGHRSIFATAIRKIYFNLHTQLPRNKTSTLGITSCLPNEGKSTVSTCLAFAATVKKQRIAIVDFDMWHHGVESLTGTDKQPSKPRESFDIRGPIEDASAIEPASLEDWFTKGATLDEIRISASQFENVDIYPWVVRHDEGFVDIDEAKVKNLFRRLRAEYDLILVDTAPFLLVSETTVITSELDGFIVIVAWEKVTDRVLLDLKRAMDLAKVKVIGSILNGIDPTKQKLYGLGEYMQYYKGPDGYT
ncbi:MULTISPECIES: polysaccharide biosynthesis tyrosine autokinase [Halocynthiibacter]|uniref:AAA family ATPase n=1 Tax=Halocynthiibacter halioticoli TaxID=2986804 RepID=A0AAE3LUK3_9RHOB|nr:MULTISPECIES: polysaccharide biosynthesis tyrosine autokinase [Halocynthiibacter]MCV6824505.1 AAA family ATPase [Halocynthiibacter halioticoli]MCW4057506.1 AAA family ATPase [Halocynthiibacter sp. SDUM655004]